MNRLLLAIARPGKMFQLLRSNPAWIAQFAILALATIVLGVASHSRLVQLTVDHLPAGASSADREAIRAMLDSQMWVRSMFLPFRLLAGYAGMALLMLFATRSAIGRGSARFEQLLSLEVHAETAILIGQVVALACTLAGLQDNPAINPLGIDRLLPQEWRAHLVMNTLNPFTLWYLLLLIGGITFLYECKAWRAVLSVGGAWGITAAFQEGTLYLLKNAFHFGL